MFLRQLHEYVSKDLHEQDYDISKTDNVSLIIIDNDSGLFGDRGNADYAAGKSVVQGRLLKSLTSDLVRIWLRGRYVLRD